MVSNLPLKFSWALPGFSLRPWLHASLPEDTGKSLFPSSLQPFFYVVRVLRGTLDNAFSLLFWCVCCQLTSAVPWAPTYSCRVYTPFNMAKFNPSALLLLASDGDTTGLCSAPRRLQGRLVLCGLLTALCLWKASASTAMQVVPWRGDVCSWLYSASLWQ